MNHIRHFCLVAVLLCIAGCGGGGSGGGGSGGGPINPTPNPNPLSPYCDSFDLQNKYEFRVTNILGGKDLFQEFKGRDGQFIEKDIWNIRFFVSENPTSAYAYDFDQDLASVGLLWPQAAGTDTTTEPEINALSRALVIRLILSRLSQHYKNNFDGLPSFTGMNIAFLRPSGMNIAEDAKYGSSGPRGNRVSTTCVRWGSREGVMGAAILDLGNRNVDCNCGETYTTELGVFSNRVTAAYLKQRGGPRVAMQPAYQGTLVTLMQRLYDYTYNPNALYNFLQSNQLAYDMFVEADGFARVHAAAIAHQVGHSVGLRHALYSDDPTIGNLMAVDLEIKIPAYQIFFSWSTFPNRFRTALYAFNWEDEVTLYQNLNGTQPPGGQVSNAEIAEIEDCGIEFTEK